MTAHLEPGPLADILEKAAADNPCGLVVLNAHEVPVVLAALRAQASGGIGGEPASEPQVE